MSTDSMSKALETLLQHSTSSRELLRSTRLHLHHHHHINHSKEPTTPIDDAASHDEPSLTIAEPVTESHEQQQLPSDLLTEEEQEQTQTTSEESEKQDLKR